MSFAQTQEQRNFERNTLIWLNDNVQETEKFNRIKPQLRQVINYVRIYESADECVDYISSNENEHIHLLISDSLANLVIPLIDEISQIKKIYIFSTGNPYNNQLPTTFNKVKGIFTDLMKLCDAIRRNTSLCGRNLSLEPNSSSSLVLSTLPSSPTNRSHQQEAEFMYFRLLTDCLIELDHKPSTKDDFVSMCRCQYAGNESELEKLNEFDRAYSKANAISWYTRDSFLYRILNNALRIQDMDILYKIAFFIADVHYQLEDLHRRQSKASSLPSLVYRGQFMNKNEFAKKIKNNIGGFLSINSFFSTSTNKNVALMFTGHTKSDDSDTESILFEIKINLVKCRQRFAKINSLSYMEEEDETLFSIATVFRIESVQRLDSEGIWIVCLMMDGEEDEELNTLAVDIRKEIGASRSLNTFCGLLMKMGDFQKAEEYSLMLINDSEDEDLLTEVRYHSNLVMYYNEQMKFDEALLWAEKALRLNPSDPLLLAIVYINMGVSYIGKNNTKEAISYLHKANGIYVNMFSRNHPKLIPIYMNLSLAYRAEKNFSKAIEYLFQASNIAQQSLPANHPTLALAYNTLGGIYHEQHNYDLASTYLCKCLDIQERTLPKRHRNLTHTYSTLAILYLQQLNYAEAYNSCQKVLENIGSDSDHPYLPMTMYILGEYYWNKNNTSSALDCFKRAIDTRTKSPYSDQKFFLDVYKSLGTLYFHQKEFGEALNCYEKIISIALECNHPSLSLFYFVYGGIYSGMRDYETALRYNELALDIAYKTVPLNYSHIQEIEEQKSRYVTMYNEFVKTNAKS